MLKMFRGRPYGRLLRQLDDARHDLITETAKAEEAAQKADLAQARIRRLEAWIKELDETSAQRNAEIMASRIPPMPQHLRGQQLHPA